MNRLHVYWRLFWLLRKMHLMRTFEYRGNLIFWAGVSLMWTAFNFFFFGMIAGVSRGIGTWGTHEIFILLSVFNIVDTFMWSFFYPNMRNYTQAIFTGNLSQYLTKPISPQFLLMVQENNYTGIARFIAAIIMLAWSLYYLSWQFSLVSLGLFLGALTISMCFLYFGWFALGTLAFWVEKLDNINDIVPSARRIWQVPREVYTGVISTIFTVLLPIGLITSLPSELLLGKASIDWLFFFSCITIAVGVMSNHFFSFSIKKFAGVGN